MQRNACNVSNARKKVRNKRNKRENRIRDKRSWSNGHITQRWKW